MKHEMIDERLRIGRQLAELRQKKGLTIRQLSELSGITNPHINRIENGKYSVGLDTLATLCKALGCKVNIIEVD